MYYINGIESKKADYTYTPFVFMLTVPGRKDYKMFRASDHGFGLREYHRFRVNYEFNYIFNARESRCDILNISEGGMLLKVRQILDIDDIITVYLELDSITRRKFDAVVRHTNYNYVGVKFVVPDEEEREVINSFIYNIKDQNKYRY